MKLLSAGGAYINVSKATGVRIDDYESHGLIMWATWTFGALIEVCTNRYLKHYSPYHQYVHTLVGIAITVITILSGYEMMEHTGKKSLHSFMGFTVMGIAILLFVTGLILAIAANVCNLSWKRDFTRIFRKAHKIIGLFVTLVALFTISNGVTTYISKSNWTELRPAGIINLGVGLLTLLALEIFYRIWRKKETPWMIPEKKMTSDQVHNLV